FQRRAERLMHEHWKLTEYDVLNWSGLCEDMEHRKWGDNYKTLWARAAIIPGSMEAKRAVLQLRQGVGLSANQMNAVIGLLNELLLKPGCCKGAKELEDLTSDGSV